MESFLAHGAETLSSGDRYQAVVHVDAQTLRDGCAGRCEHEDGPALPAETARRLSCDASLVCIVEDEDGEPLDVGRKSRTIAPPIRRALRSRDRGCRFPGCPNQHYVDGHHIKHWADGGETRLSNLALLCRNHHRKVHEGGVSIQVLGDGTLRFTLKDGRSFDSPVPARPGEERGPLAGDVRRADWTDLLSHEPNDIVITAETAATRWRGEQMDYGIAVEALLRLSNQQLSADRHGITQLSQTPQHDAASSEYLASVAQEMSRVSAGSSASSRGIGSGPPHRSQGLSALRRCAT